MQPSLSHILRYDGIQRMAAYGGRTITCRLQIFENRWNTVVIATDLSDSLSASITLHTEELATMVCDRFGVEVERLLWIEHIPQDDRLERNEDLYDLVHFEGKGRTLTRPLWTPLSFEEVALLAGRSNRLEGRAEEYR